MFEALVITLREGVEAALVLAIAAGLLRRQGQDARVTALLGGAGVALVASAVLAWLAGRVTWNEEIVEGIAMLVGAVCVLSLTWWMWKAAPRMKQEIESGLAKGARAGALGVALFGFLMVLREGFETAVFLAAAEFNSGGLMMWAGAGIGLALATGFGVLFARGAFKVPLKPFFSLTTAVLLLLAFQLLVGGLHELSEGQVLPASRTEMAIIGPLVKNELLLFTLTLALALGWMLFGAGRDPRDARATGASEASAPELRLARATAARQAAWQRGLGVLGLAVVGLLAAAFATRSRIPGAEPATALTPESGRVQVDAATFTDGRMHFYEVETGVGRARFFVLQSASGLHTSLDACEICGPIGYFLEGSAVICRNCTSPIALGSLERGGGCNPVPLAHRLEGGRLTIDVAAIEQALPSAKGR